MKSPILIYLISILVVVSLAIGFVLTNSTSTQSQEEQEEYELVPGGVHVLYSYYVGKFVDGKLSFKEFLQISYGKSIASGKVSWVKVYIKEITKPEVNLSKIPRDCKLLDILPTGIFYRAIVLDVIYGNRSLKGKTITLHIATHELDDNKILFPEEERPLLPGKMYVIAIEPIAVEVTALCMCNGVDTHITVTTVNSYITDPLDAFAVINNRVYHLVFSKKLSLVDEDYRDIIPIFAEEYKGKDPIIINEGMDYNTFIKELLTIINDINKTIHSSPYTSSYIGEKP